MTIFRNTKFPNLDISMLSLRKTKSSQPRLLTGKSGTTPGRSAIRPRADSAASLRVLLACVGWAGSAAATDLTIGDGDGGGVVAVVVAGHTMRLDLAAAPSASELAAAFGIAQIAESLDDPQRTERLGPNPIWPSVAPSRAIPAAGDRNRDPARPILGTSAVRMASDPRWRVVARRGSSTNAGRRRHAR